MGFDLPPDRGPVARDATLGPPDVCSVEAKAGGGRIRHAVGLETMDRPASRVGRRLRRGGDWRVLGPAAVFSPPSDRPRPRRRGLAAARRLPGGRDDAEPRAAGAGGPLGRSPRVQAAPVAARLDHDDDGRQPPAAPGPRLHALQPTDRRAGAHHLRRAAREGRLGDGRRPREGRRRRGDVGHAPRGGRARADGVGPPVRVLRPRAGAGGRGLPPGGAGSRGRGAEAGGAGGVARRAAGVSPVADGGRARAPSGERQPVRASRDGARAHPGRDAALPPARGRLDSKEEARAVHRVPRGHGHDRPRLRGVRSSEAGGRPFGRLRALPVGAPDLLPGDRRAAGGIPDAGGGDRRRPARRVGPRVPLGRGTPAHQRPGGRDGRPLASRGRDLRAVGQGHRTLGGPGRGTGRAGGGHDPGSARPAARGRHRGSRTGGCGRGAAGAELRHTFAAPGRRRQRAHRRGHRPPEGARIRGERRVGGASRVCGLEHAHGRVVRQRGLAAAGGREEGRGARRVRAGPAPRPAPALGEVRPRRDPREGGTIPGGGRPAPERPRRRPRPRSRPGDRRRGAGRRETCPGRSG